MTAFGLRELADQGCTGIIIHRRTELPDHAPNGCACWCEPLVLNGLQMHAGVRDLQQLLAEHYAVH